MHRRGFLRLTALLAAAGLPATPGPAAATARAAAGGVTFAPVRPGHPLRFPEDHGAHPDFRTEWWYVTGWLHPVGAARADCERSDDAPLGFQATFFRVRTGIGEDNPSAFAPRQLLLAHAAIADPALGRLRHAERSARASLGRAGFAAGLATGPTAVWVDDWRLAMDANRYRVAVQADDFAYTLDLVPAGPPMQNGEAGFSRKAADPRHASYYYSRPQLGVAGRVTLAGETRSVCGQAWLDHEWSSELLPPDAMGWDWVGMNLADGSALMAFRMRGESDDALWAAATLGGAGGSGRTETFAPAQVRFEPLEKWRSPRTAITYPIAWRLVVGERIFTVRALMPDQELDSRRSTGAIYWEGAARLLDGQREVGRGYLEMTGYGERIQW